MLNFNIYKGYLENSNKLVKDSAKISLSHKFQPGTMIWHYGTECQHFGYNVQKRTQG